ncbi:MAG: hypothetical protein ACK55I_43775, partial [bacterium]
MLEEKASLTPKPREITTKPRFSDRIFRGVIFTGALSSLVILAAIAIFLGARGFEILVREGLSFITRYEWYSSINADGTAGEDPST